jgi:hypothetical protein
LKANQDWQALQSWLDLLAAKRSIYTKNKMDDNEDNMNDAFLEYLLGNDDDDDDDDIFFLSVMASIVSKQQQCLKQEHELLLPKRSRKSFYVRNRLEWCKSLAKKDHMPFHASIVCRNLHLSSSLNPFACVDGETSWRQTKGKEPISVEIILHCVLRWLSGGCYLDICLSAGISCFPFTGVYMLELMQLYCVIPFPFPPTSDADLQGAADGKFDGCVACVDGILLKIQTPAASEVGNVKSFFSGHYETYGING